MSTFFSLTRTCSGSCPLCLLTHACLPPLYSLICPLVAIDLPEPPSKSTQSTCSIHNFVICSPFTVNGYLQLKEALPVFGKMKKICVGEDTQVAFEALTDESATAVCPDSDPASLAAVMIMYDSIHG